MAYCRSGYTITPLQKTLLLVIGGSMAGVFLASTAHAAILDLKENGTYPPDTFEDVETSIDELEEYIDDAQCGGWNWDKSAVGKIPTVSGVPGRDGDPFALIPLGMAKREETGQLLDDGYQFPDRNEVRGWTSACGRESPCGNAKECQSRCVDLNRWQYPMWLCLYTNEDGGVDWNYDWLDCQTHEGNDPNEEPERPSRLNPINCNIDIIFLGWYYCCTDSKVTNMMYESCSEANLGACLENDANRNCLRCEGDGAATEPPEPPSDPKPTDEPVLATDFHENVLGRRPNGDFNETGCRVGRNPLTAQSLISDIVEGPALSNGEKRKYIQPRTYTSFYRHYASTSYSRGAVSPEVKNDNNEESGISVRCYGDYKEFDPRLRVVTDQDKNCVIDISNNKNLSIDKMKTSQKGKGETSKDMTFLDPAFSGASQEGEMTIWRNDLDNSEESNEVHLLEMPSKYQRSTVQMTEAEPRSNASLIRAFDETIATDPIEYDKSNLKRTLVEWWQEQQTEGNKIFTPPVLRLVVPPAWSIDLDPLQPLLTTRAPEEELAQWKENTVLQPIEIQLELREDMLGEVAGFLEKSLLLQIEQDRVPIAVPLGSATELRAMREGWCHWYKYQNKEESCDNASGDLKALLDSLANYADRIDDYRKLRAELTLYMAEYLKIHNEINANIGKWALDNMKAFFDWQEDIDERMEELKEEWEKVQAAYRNFHDDSNLKWCRNDRFTTPIYSLLDPWMIGRPNLKNDDPNEENRLPTIKGELSHDLMFDLTRLNISTGAIRIPVLDPIQISYNSDLLRPPSDASESPAIPKLPALPEIPSIAKNIEKNVPTVEVGNNIPSIIYAPISSIDIDETKEKMIEIREVIEGMDKVYNEFWNTLRRVNSQNDLNCWATDSGRCKHVEMDLIERLTRIGARPAVLLQEDLLSIGSFRKPLECPTEDWVCVLLNPQTTFIKTGWEVQYSPSELQEQVIGKLRSDMIEDSLTTGINLQSPQEEVLASFDIPMEIVLIVIPTTEK